MNCLPSALFLALAKISPVLTSDRYLMVDPSGAFGKEEVMMSSHRPSCRQRAGLRQRRVVEVLVPLRRDRDREVVGHHDGLVVERDVVVGVLPGRGGGRRAALDVGVGIVLQRVDQAVAHLGVVDQELAVIVDQLDVVGVHEGVERLERVGRFHAHRLADGIDALSGGLADRRLHLVAPERPVTVPVVRDVALLEARLLQHVLPDLDVHALLLQREAVIGLLLGDVVVEFRGFQRVRHERGPGSASSRPRGPRACLR